MHVCEHIYLALERLHLFGVRVGKLADPTAGGKAYKNNFVESWVTVSGLKPLPLFITGKLLLLGKSRELLLLLALVLSNFLEQDGNSFAIPAGAALS